MGPRTRRRLTVGLVALAVVAAVAVGVVVFTGGGGSSSSTGLHDGDRYIGPTDARYDANFTKVIFGMTKAQVEKIVGPPTRVTGSCWQYRVNQFSSFRGSSSTWNAARLCFYEGKYSESHTETNGIWDYQPKITFTQ
jgi:hypothetical protein